MKRIFLNETGQMTVFVALIFQVLFVFFAMVINIGLLVHDKINLQNAVDLGAYYGAQRQAEILNEIAHINYQIRQDNKLLAWRYHVLGTLGRDAGLGYTPGSSPGSVNYQPNAAEFEDPSVCVLNTFWFEATKQSSEQENYCYRQYGSAGTIKKIPTLTVTAPFLPGVILGRILIDNLIQTQRGALSNQGPLNWTFAAQMMVAYKMAIASRKAVIQQLATNLVKDDPPDQNNQSTRQGVFQTVSKNLTVSNLATFSEENFDFKNGLAAVACAGANNDGSPTIVEMRTSPLLLYTYSTETGGFQVNQAFLSDIRFDASSIPTQQFDFLSAFTKGEPSTSIKNMSEIGLQASSLGFEKNPWCMAYVAVSAKTTPRKPFAPFGQAVELVARAFAQPFGGRIGPWYKNQWPQSSEVSSGTRVDPLTPPRMYNDASDGNGDYKALLPNYSRYPGDQLGIKSLAHQAGARQFIRGYKRGAGGGQLTFDYFTNFDRIPITGDPLAFDNTTGALQDKVAPGVKNIRTAEEIAIAPDLFDATYYSIDLNYSSNYKRLSMDGGGARFGSLGTPFGLQRTVAPDLGGRNGASFDFTVRNQIETANSGLDQMLRNTLGYYLSDAAHVLTAWAPNNNSNFEFPTNRFAKCSAYASKAEYMIPGVCTTGGRVGYSVRIISRDHLLSDKWQIGGEGQVGPIKNPPPLDF